MSGLPRRLAAEALGTALLLATVIGSGVMGERLAAGNMAVALLANSIATGAMLFVLIAALGPLSGAHFNPAVTLAMAVRREIAVRDALLYAAVQCAAALAGVMLAHAMFDLPLLQESAKLRSGPGQWIAEAVATGGLVVTILGTRHQPGHVAPAVALYITAAYWFTASTSFANPAVTLARSFSDTFAGIAPSTMPAFIAVQFAAALAAGALCAWLFRPAAQGAMRV
jgi:glycerol uptake facilitator-like aquaporin